MKLSQVSQNFEDNTVDTQRDAFAYRGRFDIYIYQTERETRSSDELGKFFFACTVTFDPRIYHYC